MPPGRGASPPVARRAASSDADFPRKHLQRFDLTRQESHDSFQPMFAQFLTPAYLPFAIALAVMIGIGLIEAIGLGGVDELVDAGSSG